MTIQQNLSIVFSKKHISQQFAVDFYKQSIYCINKEINIVYFRAHFLDSVILGGVIYLEEATMEFNKIDKEKEYTVVQQAMEQIRNLIVAGQYKPGDRLPTEMELASRFGISRSSLREAIKLFNYLGVLESRVAKGTFICEKSNISGEAISLAAMLGEKNSYDVMEFSASIFLWCSMYLTKSYREDPDGYSQYITRLEDDLVRYKIACELGNLSGIDNCIYKIQKTITDASGNDVFIALTKTLHMFNSNINLKVQTNLYSQNEVTYNVYSALISAIKNGDTAGVGKVIQDLLAIEKNLISMPLPPPLQY